jgi:integrase
MSSRVRGVNVIIKGQKDSRYGYLKLSYRKGGKTYVQSLGIKVLRKDFNVRTQTLRTGAKDADKINELLELKKSLKQFLPYKTNRPKTIGAFIQQTINDTSVKSTKQKYENILNLSKEYFLIKFGKDDLYFEEIDDYVVNGFYNWLLTKEKRNKVNTANYKMKSFKSFFNKIEKQKLYSFPVNPFVSIKLSFEDTKKDFLNLKELQTFIQTDNFEDERKLFSRVKFSFKDIKESFIFSTLAQGLRVSDIITLRWNDFVFDKKFVNLEKSLVIRKKMIKTKKYVFVFVNPYCAYFLHNQIVRTYNDNLEIIEGDGMNYTFDKYIGDNTILKIYKDEVKGADNFFSEYVITDEQKGKLKYNIEQLEYEIFFEFYNLVKYLSSSKKIKTEFVFPFLDNKLFENIDEENDFSRLTDNQFLQFQGRRSYLNLLLKKMMKQITSKKISFHSARHTYTSLTLENDEIGVNIYDLMNSLGHTSLISTEKYIRGLNYNKINQLNLSLSKSIFDEQS